MTARPLEVILDTTERCNLKCKMCYFSAVDRLQFPPFDRNLSSTGMMPLETFGRVAADLFPRAHRVALGCAAEPLVHPKFVDIVREAGSYGIPDLWFPTNLLPLTPSKAEAICEAGVKTVGVSMDGTRPETYETIRVGATFVRLMRSLDLLNDVRRGAATRLRLIFVWMQTNRADLADLPRFAEEVGASELDVRFVAPTAHVTAEDELLDDEDPGALRAELAAAAEDAAARGLKLVSYPDFDDGGAIGLRGHLLRWRAGLYDRRRLRGRVRTAVAGCAWPRHTVVVRPNGAVSPCIFWEEQPIGLYPETTLAEIERSPLLSSITDGLRTGNPCGTCRTCLRTPSTPSTSASSGGSRSKNASNNSAPALGPLESCPHLLGTGASRPHLLLCREAASPSRPPGASPPSSAPPPPPRPPATGSPSTPPPNPSTASSSSATTPGPPNSSAPASPRMSTSSHLLGARPSGPHRTRRPPPPSTASSSTPAAPNSPWPPTSRLLHRRLLRPPAARASPHLRARGPRARRQADRRRLRRSGRHQWNGRAGAAAAAAFRRLPAAARRFDRLPLPPVDGDCAHAIRSRDLGRLIRTGFRVESVRPYGGDLLAPLGSCVDWSRVSGDELRRMTEGTGRSRPHYALTLARPHSGLPRRIARLRYQVGPKVRRVFIYEPRRARDLVLQALRGQV